MRVPNLAEIHVHVHLLTTIGSLITIMYTRLYTHYNVPSINKLLTFRHKLLYHYDFKEQNNMLIKSEVEDDH